MSDFIGATGYVAQHLPPGAETDTVLRLLRQGIKFDRRDGRRPGELHRYIVGIVAQIPQKPTFEKLLVSMELEAVRRDRGEHSPIERVSRSFEIIKFHDKKGVHEIPFATLRNCLTFAKKKIHGCR